MSDFIEYFWPFLIPVALTWVAAYGLHVLNLNADDWRTIPYLVAEKELARLMGPGSFSHKFTFHMLWDEIHGVRAWEANPWVWVITFRRVDA